MREQIQLRLGKLQQEYQTGQAKLRELEATIHRIEGAIMVLQELLGAEQSEDARPAVGAAGKGQAIAASGNPEGDIPHS